jgi:hypothetical protein
VTPPEINDVLNCLELTHPIELEDIAAIREALGGDVEVFHRVREVVVQLHRDGKCYYERVLPIAGAPMMRKAPL